jgi:hypothetical protein
MATLLENQAGQVLRESSTLGGGGLNPASASGDIRGFTNIAFPIVRRVFGGLIANELVSIQPMSLPSGLLFYLDYTYGTNVGGEGDGVGSSTKATYTDSNSIYNNPAGKGVRSGSLGVGGQYDLAGSGYSRVHTGSNATTTDDAAVTTVFKLGSATAQSRAIIGTGIGTGGADGRFLQFDPQISSLIDDDSGKFFFLTVDLGQLGSNFDVTAVKEVGLVLTGSALNMGSGNSTDMVEIPETIQGGAGLYNVRRLNMLVTSASAGGSLTPAPMAQAQDAGAAILMVVSGTASEELGAWMATYPKTATLDSSDGSTLVVPTFESNFSQSNAQPEIPEIDIKIESISVVAQTRKLRARWSPELAQDLNAYHSFDAEVEFIQILLEQIALEIDREILNDLLM